LKRLTEKGDGDDVGRLHLADTWNDTYAKAPTCRDKASNTPRASTYSSTAAKASGGERVRMMVSCL